MSQNVKGRNVYVGMALRKGETGPSGRATKKNYAASSGVWDDFDAEGDDERVDEALKRLGIQPAEVTITGTIPHRRFQIRIALDGSPAPEQLESINKAIRDCLGGDDVGNCDRVMRLAGTVSYPTPTKVERGYVPELTRLLINKNAHAYDPELLVRLLRGNEPRAAGGSMNGKSAAARTIVDIGDNFWHNVNDLALANLGSWVMTIFPDAKFQMGTGAYRVSSKALGRDLEEDLSLSPDGIKDFGIHDMGDARAGKRTAVDIVVEHGGAPDIKAAALWLCEKCKVDPASLGWGSPPNRWCRVRQRACRSLGQLRSADIAARPAARS